MNWGPDNWPEIKQKIAKRIVNQSIDEALLPSLCLEVGADAMHQADIKWLENKIALNPEGTIYIEKVLDGRDLIHFRVLVEDWQVFKGDS